MQQGNTEDGEKITGKETQQLRTAQETVTDPNMGCLKQQALLIHFQMHITNTST
jgi:hypothetical protein